MAADQVGSSLELLSAPVQEQARAWGVLGSIFDALDGQRRAERKAVFFGPWLSALHTELTALADSGIGASAAIRRRVEQAVAEISPMVESAYAAGKDASDWDHEI
jgi:hypothetical protein